MSKTWGFVTPTFAHAVERMPRMTESQFEDLEYGALLAIRTFDAWTIWQLSRRDIDPERETVLLSQRREEGEPKLAWKAVERLSRILYDTRSHSTARLRGATLVAATWYFPEWDWYLNEPVFDENGRIGFNTTEGMWGELSGSEEHQAEGLVVVCDDQSRLSYQERQEKLRKGGWPGPKDWSPRGRLPKNR